MPKTYVLNMNGRKATIGDVIGGGGFWRWDTGVAKVFTVSAPIYKGQPMNRTGITTAPDLLDVVDVADGESKRLLCGKVLVSTLLENFPDDSYVGKTFQVTMGPVPAGKRYKTCEVRLVELEESDEEPQEEFRNGGARGASGRTEPTKPKGKK